MIDFLSGVVTCGYLVAGGLFFNLWRRTGDTLLRAFTFAFVLFALNQVLAASLVTRTEPSSLIYSLRILGFVVAIDWVFFGLTALALVVLRRRDLAGGIDSSFRVPGHPFTTIAFVAGSWLVVANTVYRFPGNALAGLGLLVAGIPVYLYWRRGVGR